MVLPLSHKTEKETKKGIHGGNNVGDHRVPVKSKYWMLKNPDNLHERRPDFKIYSRSQNPNQTIV